MTREPPKAITTQAEADEADRKAMLRKHRDDTDMAALASTPAGRRHLYRLFHEGRVFGVGFMGSADVHFRDGQQALTVPIFLHMMEVAPGAWGQMLQENKEDDLA